MERQGGDDWSPAEAALPPPPPPGTSLAAWECSHPWLLRDILWGCLFVGLLAFASPPVVRERLDGYPRLPGWAPLQLHLTWPPCFWGTETLCPGAHAHKKARTHAHRYTHRGTGKQREDRCSSSLLPRNFTLLHARNQPPFILSRWPTVTHGSDLDNEKGDCMTRASCTLFIIFFKLVFQLSNLFLFCKRK